LRRKSSVLQVTMTSQFHNYRHKIQMTETRRFLRQAHDGFF